MWVLGFWVLGLGPSVLARGPPEKNSYTFGAGLYHHLQASTMTEMLAGNGACNRNCNGKERSCNGFVNLSRSCNGAVSEICNGALPAVAMLYRKL